MSDNKKRAVIALGFFDGVHLGHQKVLKSAIRLAKELNAKAVAFTFNGNLKSVFKDGEKNIYGVNERISALISVGIDEIISAPLTTEFLSLSAQEFLGWLDDKYEVVGYVSGDDYRFGKGGKGDANYLKNYAEKTGKKVITESGVMVNGKRVSSTLIKGYLAEGNIKIANELLGKPYFVKGEVFKDREVGKTLGFPTVNIKISTETITLKDGVYAGKAIIDNKLYRAIINYGARPTFNLTEKLLEAHFIGFNGNLYGKEIEISFTDFIRPIIKFNDKEELIAQLKKDTKETGEGIYD